jgi:DNA-binding NtrC family response regulator
VATVLCIDDDPLALAALVELISGLGHEPISAAGAAAALAALTTRSVDVVVTDFQLPGMTGSDLLTIVRDEGHQCPFIIVTAFASIEQAVTAIQGGAVNYLAKPVSPPQLEASLLQALELVELRAEVDTLRAEASSAKVARRIIGNSEPIRQVMHTIASVAATRATVLIEGESGTGKELFARALHDLSDRARRPFIRINCAALPEGLIESSLFGHERGAFTGALRRAEGAFERADGGTLLLDEISEMRLDLQAKLLRVLQEQEFERVGGNSMLKVDVRVVATTNRDLAADARSGAFRADLYYRLKVVQLRIPPLRDRPDDIAALANAFLQRFAAESKRNVERFDPACLEQLCTLPWPGNVRELEHAVYRAVLLAEGPTLTWRTFEGMGEGLPNLEQPVDAMSSAVGSAAATVVAVPSPDVREHGTPRADVAAVLPSFDLHAAEQVLIDGALLQSGGNRTRAARLLGINVRTLRRKLAERGQAAEQAEALGVEDEELDATSHLDVFPAVSPLAPSARTESAPVAAASQPHPVRDADAGSLRSRTPALFGRVLDALDPNRYRS